MTGKTRITQQGTAFDTKQSKQKMTPGLANHTSEAEQFNQKAGESPIEESTKNAHEFFSYLPQWGLVLLPPWQVMMPVEFYLFDSWS